MTKRKITAIERHYAKHKEDLRLLRRHGQVEFAVTMMQIEREARRLTEQLELAGERRPLRVLDVGAGTGRYAMALKERGMDVECVELVQHNIDVMLSHDAEMRVRQGDARSMPWVESDTYDLVLLLGPLYHLPVEADKLLALTEARRVLRPGGSLFAAYLMNEYSILTYCFMEDRMPQLMAGGFVDADFHVRTPAGELYDYVRLDDIDRLNALAGLKRQRIFSPEGAADYMRTPINRLSDESFQLFIDYQKRVCERMELIGAGSHVVDLLTK